jgi:hypothetical protein
MLRGFEIGIYNSRGTVWHAAQGGGEQERSLAAKYDERASAIEIVSPSTAAVLRHLADTYREEARREDERAEWDV